MIRYRKGYKYQLAEDSLTPISIFPPATINTKYITLRTDGMLFVREGYAWDGCSGPTLDDKTNMHGGLVHDALYQLMRRGDLSICNKAAADMELRKLCLEDGMNRLRAWYYYQGVKLFGYGSAKLQPEVILEAP